jgi:hypothetical protein
VIEERAAFEVRLVDYDMKLRRPPDKPNDFLPRYHKVSIEVTKTRPVKIPVLTVILERRGSKYGADNIWHLSLPVGDLPAGQTSILESYAFDPFNVPFQEMAVNFNPAIDLVVPSRTMFKELSGLFAK